MKIAHINWSLGTGGIENMVSEIVSEQAKTDDIALFVINDWIEDYILKKIDNRVHLYLIGRKSGSRNPFPLIKFNLLLSKFHPDIIHCHATGLINLVFCPYGKRIRTIHNTSVLHDKIYISTIQITIKCLYIKIQFYGSHKSRLCIRE